MRRDEGAAFGSKFDAANGLIYDYGLLNTLSDVPAARTTLRQAANAPKTHLN